MAHALIAGLAVIVASGPHAMARAAVTTTADTAGLTLSIFANTAGVTPAAETSVVVALGVGPVAVKAPTADAAPFSAALTGTLNLAASVRPHSGASLTFICDFGEAVVGHLHIDDHLVCTTGINSRAGSVVVLDQPLAVLTRTALPVRMFVSYNTSGPAARNSFTIAPGCTSTRLSTTGGSADPHPQPCATGWFTLTPTLPANEVQRHAMQTGLASGWGAWYQMDFLKQVLLPEGACVTLQLCDLNAKTCSGPAFSGGKSKAPFRLAEHAVDRSYGRMFLADGGCNVSIEFGGGDELLVLVTPVPDSSDAAYTAGRGLAGCRKHAVVATGTEAWYRRSTITTPAADQMRFDSIGLRTSVVYATAPTDTSLPLPPDVAAMPHFAIALGGANNTVDTVGWASGTPHTVAELVAAVGAARTAELARYTKFGALAETKKAVQAAVMWTSIFNPLESGPFANVIRGNPFFLDNDAVNKDWAYVIFDWDNTFASLMLSFDSVPLGLSALIQVVRSRTGRGYVSNWATPGHKRSWSQPPIASRVLLEMYSKSTRSPHGNDVAWAVELLFDDLLDWNTWYVNQRTLGPLNITCLGGSDNSYIDRVPSQMQVGRWESGMDNSPMYDDWANDFADGKMQLYDVGQASLHTMDSDALATLALAIGRTSDAAVLKQRADTMRRLISANLWDDAASVFTNKKPDGSFLPRISPTSFYPLIVKAATPDQVARTSTAWLLNSTRFCLSPKGDFAGNSDQCYWGLPSISADDPAFPKLGYWRGYIWGPMAMLTYWGLEEYPAVPAAAQAQASLVKQMNTMMLDQWRRNGDVCENYMPHKVAPTCTGMPFYHWGALTGFLSLLDAGLYE